MVKKAALSALALGLSLGAVTAAEAGEWTGSFLTFGISSANTELRPTGTWFTPDVSGTNQGVYAGAGYDFPVGNLTMGFVADIDAAGTEDIITAGKGFYSSSDWFATVRGRVGVPVSERMHVYASGGLAFMRIETTAVDIIGSSLTSSDTLRGTAAGIGMEYQIRPGGHLSVEYVYADFKASDETSFGGVSGQVDPYVSSLRLGYTFRF